MPHRLQPFVAANGQLPPQGRCGGQAFRQRGGDHPTGERSCGEEDDGQKRSEHIDEPCHAPLARDDCARH
jgi:hypothetical protein